MTTSESLKELIQRHKEEYEAKYRETPCVFAGNKRSGCVICKGLVYDRIVECEAFYAGRRIQIARDENIPDDPW
jgi:hypothetical protein